MQSSMNSSGDIARKCKPPFNSLTGSSRGIVRRNGEVTALSHPVSNGSWKESEASAVRMQSDSVSKLSYKDPNVKQALTAYHPNAPRSRLPLQFKGEAQPFRRFCAPRNCTSPDFNIGGNAQSSADRFRTTNQNYYASAGKLHVGESNQGIVAEKTKWLHSRQQAN